ncbi:hypothetical protein ES703_69499 [subsurface metagenome]
MAVKRLGFDSLTSSTPPNLDSIGIPAFSNTPFMTTLHTVANPILPLGITIEPSFSPSDAVATSSLTHNPALKASLIAANAFWKFPLSMNEVFMGSWPVRFWGSKVVLKASNSSLSYMKPTCSGASAIRSSSRPCAVSILPSRPSG